MELHLDGSITYNQLYLEYNVINEARAGLASEQPLQIELIYQFNNKTERLFVSAHSVPLWVTKFGDGTTWIDFEELNIGKLNYQDRDKAVLTKPALSSQFHKLLEYVNGIRSAGRDELRKCYLVAVFAASEAVRSSACRQCIQECMRRDEASAQIVEPWNKWEEYKFLCNNWSHASKAVYGKGTPYAYVSAFDVEIWVKAQAALPQSQQHEKFPLMKDYASQYRNVLAKYIEA